MIGGNGSLAEPAVGRELIKCLKAALRNRQLYPPEHPEVREPARTLLKLLADAQGTAPEVTLALRDAAIYLNGVPLRETSVQNADFLSALAEYGVELLRFSPGVTLDEVSALIDVLTLDVADVERGGGVGGMLRQNGVSHITNERMVALPEARFGVQQHEGGGHGNGSGDADFEDALGEGDAGGGPAPSAVDAALEPPRPMQQAYGHVVGDVRAMFGTVAETGELNANQVTSAASKLVRELLDDPGAFLGLLHLRSIGDEHFQHAVNVALLSVLLASKLDLEEEQLRVIGIGALLHDLGELEVPKAILEKAGPLTEDEWTMVKEHPARGAKIVLGTVGLEPVVACMALEHHVGFRRRGYPQLRARRRPHLYARIVAVADTYDALTHPRPYQAGETMPQPVERLLQVSGVALDPSIVRILMHCIGYYPPGTPVALSDGRTGIAESPTPGQPFLPRVLVPTGAGVELVDLAALARGGPPPITITGVQGPPNMPARTAERLLLSDSCAT